MSANFNMPQERPFKVLKQLRVVLSLIMAFSLFSHEGLAAQEILVRNAQELNDAIAFAPTNTVIIIDAPGGVIDLGDNFSGTLADLGGNRNLVIKAKEGTSVIIKGEGSKQLFATVGNSTGTVVFENINFSAGNNDQSSVPNGGGGVLELGDPSTAPAIRFQGDLLKFTNNRSEYIGKTNQETRGGGVFSGGTLEFTNNNAILFENNSAHYSDERGTSSGIRTVAGGGVLFLTEAEFNNNGDVTFSENSTVFNKSSSVLAVYYVGGGAIRGGATPTASSWVSQTFNNLGHVIFYSNSVRIDRQSGGGFSDDSGGGAIFAGYQTFNNIGDVRFIKNYVLDKSAVVSTSLRSGGAISLGDQTFANIGNVIFSENYVQCISATGGAINTLSNPNSVQRFNNQGDVIFANNRVIGESNVPNIVTEAYGGVVYHSKFFRKFVGQSFTNTGNVVFKNNYAQAKNEAAGGVSVGSYLDFQNQGDVIFSENFTLAELGQSNGGVSDNSKFYIKNNGNIEIADNYAISKNTGNGNGGAFCNGETLLAASGDTLISGNMASNLGGVYYGAIGQNFFTLAPRGTGVVKFINNWHGVTFDGLSPDLSTGTPNAIYFFTNSTLNLNPEVDAKILFYDPIESQAGIQNNNKIVQNGPGTVKMFGDSNYHGATEILDGRFLMMKNATFGGEDTASHGFDLGTDATIGFSVDRNMNHATLHTNVFQATGTPNLYVPGVSTLFDFEGTQAGDKVYKNVIISNDSTTITSVDQVQRVTTPLMDAFLRVNATDNENADLVITWIRNISDVYDLDPHIDHIRPYMPQDTVLGDLLDSIYHDPHFVPDQEFKDFIIVNKGEPVANVGNSLLFDAGAFSRIMHGCSANSDGKRHETPSDYLIRCSAGNNGIRKQMKPKSALWGSFTQHWTAYNNSQHNLKHNYNPYSFSVGKDYFARNWAYGYVAQYVHGNARAGSSSFTNIAMDTGKVGAYLAWQTPHTYVKSNVQAGVAWNEEETYYSYLNEKYQGKFQSTILGASVEFGKKRRLGCVTHPWELAPHIGFDYYYIHTGSFSESGFGSSGMAHHFGHSNYLVGELPVGCRLSKTFNMTGGKLKWIKPSVDFNYVRSVCDSAPVSTIGFRDYHGLTWSASGVRLGRDVFRMNASLASFFYGGLEISASYDLATRNNHFSQGLRAELSKTW